jgi:hypothetical protein
VLFIGRLWPVQSSAVSIAKLYMQAQVELNIPVLFIYRYLYLYDIKGFILYGYVLVVLNMSDLLLPSPPQEYVGTVLYILPKETKAQVV